MSNGTGRFCEYYGGSQPARAEQQQTTQYSLLYCTPLANFFCSEPDIGMPAEFGGPFDASGLLVNFLMAENMLVAMDARTKSTTTTMAAWMRCVPALRW